MVKLWNFAGLTGKEKVIDAYCGIGTIGLVASGKAREVVGVELNKDAVRDARINARENKVVNISFRQGDAGEFMEAMAEAGEKGRCGIYGSSPLRQQREIPEFRNKTLSEENCLHFL